MRSQAERSQPLGPSTDRQGGIRGLTTLPGVQQTPVRMASAVADEQDDRRGALPEVMQQGFPGPALPGLWRRAAPQFQVTLQEQMADLGGPLQQPSRYQPDQYPAAGLSLEQLQTQKSLRDLYALPGQVRRTGNAHILKKHRPTSLGLRLSS